LEPALALRQGAKMSVDGYASGGLLATYVHAHFAGALHLARSIVQHCRRHAAANA
jgi:cobyrinic acid a,c-diamide synthase